MPNFEVDFLGIGAEKAATYWVTAILRDHPEVCFSKRKEIAFFNEFDQHFLNVKNPKYEWGIGWYKKHFSHCRTGKLKGEYTPTYLYSKKAVRRIKENFPNVKLIVCLRDPVKRAFSQYLHDKSIGLINKLSFEEVFEKHEAYFEKGLYYKYLKNYYEAFPEKNIFVTFVEDIKKDNKAVVKKIYKFLGLKRTDFIPTSLNKKPNVASTAKLRFLNELLLKTEYFLRENKLNFLLNILENTGIRKAAFLFSYYINRKPLDKYPKINKATEKKLRKLYRKDIEKLEKLLKRNLSSWKN